MCRLDEVIPADLAAVVDISSLHKAATDKEYLAEKGLRWVSTDLNLMHLASAEIALLLLPALFSVAIAKPGILIDLERPFSFTCQ